MGGVQIKDFLKARRDRALGAILGYSERSFQRTMSDDDWQSFRAVVIDALNGYHDSVLDLVKSDNGSVRNDLSVELLDRLDTFLTAQNH